MERFLKIIGAGFLGFIIAGIFQSVSFHVASTRLIKQIQDNRDALISSLAVAPYRTSPLGADQFLPVAGKPYKLYQSISQSDSQVVLTEFTTLDGRELSLDNFGGVKGCATIEPNNASKKEFVSFNAITQDASSSRATLVISRGLDSIPPYNSNTTTLAHQHAGGVDFVLSNSPCFYQNFAIRDNDETILQSWYFDTPPVLNDANATSSSQAASRSFAASLAAQGAADTSLTVKGVGKLARPGEAASSTVGSASTTILGINLITANPQDALSAGTSTIAITYGSGKLDLNWLATSSQVLALGKTASFNGGFITNASSTFTIATTTFAGQINLPASTTFNNLLTLHFPATASSSATAASGTELRIKPYGNGLGGEVTFAHPEFEKIGEIVITSATRTLQVFDLPFRRTLYVEAFIPGFSGDTIPRMFFSNSNGGVTTYGFQGYIADAGPLYVSNFFSGFSTDNIALGVGGNLTNTGEAYYSMKIYNTSGAAKAVLFDGVIGINASATTTARVTGSGVFNNTAAPITIISIQAGTGANTFNAGSRLTIYGSSD